MAICVNASQSIAERILRWIFRILICLFLFLLILLGGIYVFLQRDPDALVQDYLGELEAQTGLKFKIGSINVTLLPLPAIALGDLQITGKNMNFTAAWTSARPGFLKMLHGNFMPSAITILRPRLVLHSDLPLDDPIEALRAFTAHLPASSAKKPALPDLNLEINQMSVEITGQNNSKLSLTGLHTQSAIHSDGELAGLLHLSATRLLENKIQLMSLENLQLTGSVNLFDFFADSHNLQINGLLRWKGVLRSCDFKGVFNNSSSGWDGETEISGDIDLGEAKAPVSIKSTLKRLANPGDLLDAGLEWRLGADSGHIDLTCHLPPAEFLLKGTLKANRLSLTEWLGFARNLTPGLQIALDNITRASMDFSLSAADLVATNIQASCSGSTFTGNGGVADWKKPVVRLEMHTPIANLVRGLPEAAAETPDSPWYPHEPLTPLPTEPLKPGEQGIGYDIRLSADKLLYGPVKFEKASLQIHPGKLDTTGFQDVLLDAKANFYGGSVTGHCILGADPSLPYYIKTVAKNINGPSLSKDMPILPFRKGKFDATATVTSKSKHLASFLANLQGNIQTSGQNVTLSATGPSTGFTSLSAGLRLRSAAWNGRMLTFDGQWTANAKTKDFSADCTLNGKILFGKSGYNFSALPGTVNATLATGPLPANSKLKLQGKFAANPDQGKFEVSKATLEALGEKVTGDIKVDASKNIPSFQGNIKTEIPNLGKLLAQTGSRSDLIPAEFNNLKLESAIAGQPDSLKLTKMRSTLGKFGLTGSLQWQKLRQRNNFVTDLVINNYTISAPKGSSKTPNWNFKSLTEFDASGKIRIQNAVIFEARCSNINVNYKLENGKLSVSPLTANFYGAPLTCNVTADFQKGLAFKGNLHVQAFDLEAAAKDRKLQTLLRGSASLDAKLDAMLMGNTKLLGALNGIWNFNIKNGSWQSLNKKGQPQGKPTSYSSISASGTIAKGYIKSGDFLLKGDGLKVSGTSDLNLVNNKLDCHFNVDMKGWPDFPLRVYGPLSKIETSIGAGRLALNAIGEVVGGFTNAIGGLVKGAVNIFK